MSIKKNYIASLTQVFVNLVFPIITFPYVARILGPEGIGKFAYVNAIVFYFTIFIHLGIPLYGTRIVAKKRKNQAELNQTITELFIIYLISTFAVALAFIFYLSFINSREDMIIMLIIAGLNILIAPLSFNWVLQGLEKHRLISAISVFAKSINLILLLLLITNSDDYIIYLTISIIINLITALGGFYLRGRYSSFTLNKIQIKRHLKPIVLTSGINVTESLFFQLNILMLGNMRSPLEVGLYTAAIRFIRLADGLINILGRIAMPRISFYFEKNMTKELEELVKDLFYIGLILSVPATFGIIAVSEEVILILAGKQYVDAILCLQILAVSIVVANISTFYYNQVLFPRGEDKKILIRNCLVLILGLIGNFILIKTHSYNGAAVSLLIANIVGVLIYALYSKKLITFTFFNIDTFKVFLSSACMFIFIFYVPKLLTENIYILLPFKIASGAILYSLMMYLLKEKHFEKYFKRLLIKVFKIKKN